MFASLKMVVLRDLLLALRRKTEVLTTLFFFIIVISLFPLGNVKLDALTELEVALLISNRYCGIAEPNKLAVAGKHPIFLTQRQSGFKVSSIVIYGGLTIIGVDEPRPQVGIGQDLV